MPSKPLRRQLMALLFDPATFFDRRSPRRSLGSASGVVLAIALLTTTGVAAVGWQFATSIDATVTETVMEPWPAETCESFQEMNHTPEPCTIDEPRTREVDVGAEIWQMLVGKLPLVFFGTLLGWVLIAAGLHVVSVMFDGEGSFGATLSVAGWAMVPQVVQLAVGLASASLLIHGTTFSSDPAALADQLERLASGSAGLAAAVATVVVTVWQAYIWAYGLRRARNLRLGDAAVTAGVVGTLWLLFALLG